MSGEIGVTIWMLSRRSCFDRWSIAGADPYPIFASVELDHG
jgi:hypothetical protein